MRLTLGKKLFLSYLAVLAVGGIVLALVAQVSLPGAYGRHMVHMSDMMGGGASRQGGRGPFFGERDAAFLNFRASFFDALGWAALAALGMALLISFFLSRSLTAPLQTLTHISQRVAEGHYNERVPAGGSDELGQLARSFNAMAEKLEQVEAMRRRLIGDVAHELRTPLTAIQGSMEGLVDGILPADRTTFEQIASEAGRLSRLVDDLQELARVEAGAFTLNFQPVSLADLVETLRKRFATSCAAKGISLTFHLPDALPRVRADSDRLLQVLTNLLNNARQYTPSGGQVTLSAEASGHEVVVRVKDNGIGIPAEHLPHIFDRFYRVDRSRSRRAGGGSGIGLTICKYLVEAQGGRIWAESPGEGQGSTFSFTLPMA